MCFYRLNRGGWKQVRLEASDRKRVRVDALLEAALGKERCDRSEFVCCSAVNLALIDSAPERALAETAALDTEKFGLAIKYALPALVEAKRALFEAEPAAFALVRQISGNCAQGTEVVRATPKVGTVSAHRPSATQHLQCRLRIRSSRRSLAG
jgi:hypothetical protein